MDQSTKEAGKTMAIISYITFIGLAIAYISNQGDKKNEFVTFHIGQSLRIVIIVIINIVLAGILPASLGILTTIISLSGLVLMILGAINASNLKEEKLPVIGTIGE